MAIRLATKGNGTNLYGTIPTWTATNWEVEFDVVFPTTLITSGTKVLLQSPTLTNSFQLNTYTGNGCIRLLSINGVADLYLDGVSIVSNTVTAPIDGAVHTLKLVGSGLIELSGIYRYFTNSLHFSGSIFNLSLKDLSNSSNSRFYPMGESIITDSFADVLSGAQHGTWFNRTAGNIIEVTVPSADRSLISRSLITRSLITRSLISRSL